MIPEGGTDSGPKDVVILGAGFSKAVSDRMPTVDELGSLCRPEVESFSLAHLRTLDFRPGEFEPWLSRLAEDQPDLSEEANLENRGLFLRYSKAIEHVVRERQDEVTSRPPPDWLVQLVAALHQRRATVISFNYDTLIESAVLTAHLQVCGAPTKAQTVTWDDVVDHLPPLPPSEIAATAARPKFTNPATVHSVVESFRLLKLHGSVNWFWQTGDATGATMHRWNSVRAFRSNGSENNVLRNRLLPGRVPFIVPPAASKSAYYRNPIIQEIWRRASGALRAAGRVILVGYSLPLHDLVFSGMFREVTVSRTVQIEVVDLSPEPIRDRLKQLGVADERVTITKSGDRCIAEFSSQYA